MVAKEDLLPDIRQVRSDNPEGKGETYACEGPMQDTVSLLKRSFLVTERTLVALPKR
jgi:hypothetical protein